MVFPVILGDRGREPIYADLSQAALELIQTTVLDDRVVLLEYRRAPVPRPWLSACLGLVAL
jgi:hypothetical protein